MPDYVMTIRGTEVEAMLPSLQISKVANGVNTLSCEVLSLAGAFRVDLDDEVVLSEDAVTIFGGLVDAYDESAVSGWGTDILSRVSAVDYSAYLTRRYVTETFPAGSLESILTALVDDYLDDYGISLHGSQPTGPSLPELTYTRMKANEVLNDLAKRTGYIWAVDHSKVLLMSLPSTVAAPFDMEPDGGHVVGDLLVSERREDSYANRVIIVVSGAGPASSTQVFTAADGVTSGGFVYFTTKYPATLSQTDVWPNQLIINGVSLGPVGFVGISETNVWDWDAANHRLRYTSASGATFPAGADELTVTHGIGYPFEVSAEDAGDIASKGPWEVAITRAEALTIEGAQELAEAEVARRTARSRKVTYRTFDAGLEPGQQQQIDEPYRGIDDEAFVINEIRSRCITTEQLEHTISATEGQFQETYRDVYKQWFGGASSASGGVGSVSSGAPVPTVGVSMPAFLGGSLNTSVNPNSATWVGLVDAPEFVAPVSASAEVRVKMRSFAASVEMTARLYDVTAAASAGESDPVESTSAVTETFSVALIEGHEYRLEISSDTSAARLFAIGSVQAL